MAWTGFSEEMIRHMKEGNDEQSTYRESSGPKGIQVAKSKSRRGHPTSSRGRSRKVAPIHGSENGRDASELHPNQRLSAGTVEEGDAWKDLKETHSGTEDKNANEEVTTQPELEKPKNPEPRKMLDDAEGQRREISKLQELQEQQEQIEKENKIKKNFLFKAIKDREKKTKAEAKRIAFIQNELGKIENLLTNDVSILRDTIEESSRCFTDAEKRYQLAEKEFVEAKIYLHRMEEKKNALTEHLFVIIHQNEIRKAKKLEDLVSTLNTEDLDRFQKDIQQSTDAQSSAARTEGDKMESGRSLPQPIASDIVDHVTDDVIANDAGKESQILSDVVVPDTIIVTDASVDEEAGNSGAPNESLEHEIVIASQEVETTENTANINTDDNPAASVQQQS